MKKYYLSVVLNIILVPCLILSVSSCEDYQLKNQQLKANAYVYKRFIDSDQYWYNQFVDVIYFCKPLIEIRLAWETTLKNTQQRKDSLRIEAAKIRDEDPWEAARLRHMADTIRFFKSYYQ